MRNLALPLALTLVAAVIGYLINQLPPLRAKLSTGLRITRIAILCVLTAGLSWFATSKRSQPAVSIADPSPGTHEQCFVATGTADGINDDEVLWLVVQSSAADKSREDYYLMQSFIPTSDGRWSWSTVRLSLGSPGTVDFGKQYWVEAYVASRAESTPLMSKDQRDVARPDLPQSFHELDEVAVTRGAESHPGC
jgi:hypothetical protein